MNPESFDNQFVISYELLELLKWLFEHEQESLKKIVKKTIENGLMEDIFKKNSDKDNINELQQIITDFFALMENLLFECIKEQGIKKAVNKTLIPSLNNIDKTAYDHVSFNVSLEKATAACLSNPEINPKVALCKELLKRWKPARKVNLH